MCMCVVCMCVINTLCEWDEKQRGVFILQHVQLIILKVFFKEGLGCSKAIVQIQRRKYSFEKSKFFLISKLTYGE